MRHTSVDSSRSPNRQDANDGPPCCGFHSTRRASNQPTAAMPDSRRSIPNCWAPWRPAVRLRWAVPFIIATPVQVNTLALLFRNRLTPSRRRWPLGNRTTSQPAHQIDLSQINVPKLAEGTRIQYMSPLSPRCRSSTIGITRASANGYRLLAVGHARPFALHREVLALLDQSARSGGNPP